MEERMGEGHYILIGYSYSLSMKEDDGYFKMATRRQGLVKADTSVFEAQKPLKRPVEYIQ